MDNLNIKKSVYRVSISSLVFVLSALIAGCVYIPPFAQEDAGIDPASFEIGITSRSDILSALGDPLVNDGRFILDELYTNQGVFFLGGQGGGGFLPVGEKFTRLLLEFNEADILTRKDVETGSRLSHGIAPDGIPLGQLEPVGDLLPFNDIKWWRGPPVFQAAAFSPDGNLLAASDSSDQIYLFDFDRRTIELISPEGFETDGFVFAVNFSPDGNSLAILSRTVRTIDLKTREQVVLYDGHGNELFWEMKGATAMAYAPSGDVIASGGTGGMVKIWETASGREISSWAAHEAVFRAIAFSTDGTILATSGGDDFVRLWDLKTGAQLGTINRCCVPVISDDGKLLAITSPSHAELWHLDRDSSGTSSDQKLTLDGPMDMIIMPYFRHAPWMRFRPGPPHFMSEDRGLLHSVGSPVIWDWTERQKTLLRIPVGDTFLAFSPDGRTMATLSQVGVRLWRIPGESLF